MDTNHIGGGMEKVDIDGLQVSRFILGSNPFSGFSHQDAERNKAMRAWYTTERVLDVLFQAESLGIDSVIARADEHILECFRQYYEAGGKLQWLAQTCPEVGDHATCIQRAVDGGAHATYIHGGVMDNLVRRGETAELPGVVDRIHAAGLKAGIAGHNPGVFRWALDSGLPVDFMMCSYYDPVPRNENGEHVRGAPETFRPEHREAMTAFIADCPLPVIHYKVLAAGRNDPRDAFAVVARTMRPRDMVCVGIYNEERPDLLAESVGLFMNALAAARA